METEQAQTQQTNMNIKFEETNQQNHTNVDQQQIEVKQEIKQEEQDQLIIENLELVKQQLNNTIFHVQQYGSEDEESEWSSSSNEDQEQIKKELQEMMEKENKYVEGQQDCYKSKNEILMEEKAKQFQSIESKEEREKRYGCEVTGEEILIKIGTLVHMMPDNIVIESCTPEVLEQDNGVIQQGLIEFKSNILDLDNILFTAEREIIGTIEDVFGNVKNPHYIVLIDSYLKNVVHEGQLKQNDNIYVMQGKNKMLLKSDFKEMLQKRGCDASNQYDEEVLNEQERYYSDDEQEQQKKPKKKNKNRKVQGSNLEDEVNQDDEMESEQELKPDDMEQDSGQDNNEENYQNKTKQQQKNQSYQNKNEEKPNPRKKIMLFKMVNGTLQKVFVKPSQLQQLMNDPNNQIKTYQNVSELPQTQQNLYHQQSQSSFKQTKQQAFQAFFDKNNPHQQQQKYGYNNQQNGQQYPQQQNYQYQQQQVPQVNFLNSNFLNSNPPILQQQQQQQQYQQNYSQNNPFGQQINHSNMNQQQQQQQQQQQNYNNNSFPLQQLQQQTTSQPTQIQQQQQQQFSQMSNEQLQQMQQLIQQQIHDRQQNNTGSQ